MSSNPRQAPPVRIQQNILARGERRVLNWICARLPQWVTPDQLTTLGFLGAVMVAMGYMLSWLGPAWLSLSIAGYVVNWFGDSLDGSLARWRRIERPSYGYFVDHSVDGLATLLMVGSIGLSPYMRFDVALLGVIGYLLLSIHSFLAAKVVGEFRLSYMAGGPTELRLMLIAMTALMPVIGGADINGTNFSPFDLFGMVVSSVLITLFVTQSFALARKLAHRRD
ncbi:MULTISPECIES: CDP-alcohol phosphatidyltransferase family protein [unclassified Sphingopyxis]|uniref:CDP-alcohol phosphatidyltransferase family protein n=1 Tax=unclassified Sphingopyxis TaxID=2614943 RepID=UPI00073623CF|nr:MULTISPECIES: CDP-alcohol phosphatidyltransferase family protein [unclassified Sphingopyxis]KTE28613.1 CDP-alcohol phosphatidyltransferase [Sphingopyxis sp. HIX]KTE71094.1 CDP-alcohol phosphatidyltransferase [Sphingopyxis sp. HXXIV]